MLVEDATSESFGKVSLPTSNDPTAVGFAVSNASLKLGILTVGEGATTRKYTGLAGAFGHAQLQGVDSLKLIVRSFSIGINRTSVTGGDRLNWNQDSLSAAGLALTNDSPTLRIGGSAGFAIAGVVYGSATVDFNQRMISGVTTRMTPVRCV
jgi:hypothetical protein